MKDVNYKMWTLCMVQDEDRALMLNRTHDNFKGYIAPGGKLEFPESPIEGAIREVKEETGLIVKNLRAFAPWSTEMIRGIGFRRYIDVMIITSG